MSLYGVENSRSIEIQWENEFLNPIFPYVCTYLMLAFEMGPQSEWKWGLWILKFKDFMDNFNFQIAKFNSCIICKY